ncbi:polymer-forming cytoskeletal protein [Luteolibacter sp. GHJ8]|uniref:Polymer-forming cytoskeletal protein n=1 Tax=Luteolibacter rhizosphaerae TaxID=2989719 RepID=A0ABT3FXM8_9BACT|nr:polymer-forming cytoskeletal protein [Luteolibacter rhizosphaerae]MCW1912114.1 polymer-forming cytoskeletal protein [Luteolibacter rhizosphaerae]
MSNSFGFRKYTGSKPEEAPTPAAPTPAPSYAAPAPAAAAPSYAEPAPAAAAPVQQAAASSAPQRPVGPSRNVLSSDVEIKGTVKFTNDLVVDGRIEGEIQSEGNLTVGENARLKAEIKTGTVVVYGKVHGNIVAADRVELKASAEVVGDIKAKTLSIEPGAIFVGKSAVGTPSTPAGATAAAKPAAAATPAPASKPAETKSEPKAEQGNLSGVNP